MDLTEAEDIKMCQEDTEELYKKDLHDPDNHDRVITHPKRWCCESVVLNMPANLENSVVAIGLEKLSFHSNPKKGNAKECSNYRTIALTSHASKVMLKILQARLQ